jgi:UDP-N-acetylmuramate dehydrogenase
MRFLRNEKLKKHTSFRIGGPAEYFCVAKNIDQIREALAFAKEKKLALAVIGAGSNILVRDNGFPGLVIKISTNSLEINKSRVRVGSGMPLGKLVSSLSAKGIGSLEFLVGIPGSVGGAVVMNSGAWGKEIGDFVKKVKVMNRAGQEIELSRKQMGFGYRKSRLQNDKLIVTEVELKLRRKGRKAISKKVKEYIAKRKDKQPVGSPNCGSTFKNPKKDFAARLIEQSGCKGMRMGDAQVSPKHANFIVNLGDASANDVIKLMTLIQIQVKSKFGIQLEPELKIMVKSAT